MQCEYLESAFDAFSIVELVGTKLMFILSVDQHRPTENIVLGRGPGQTWEPNRVQSAASLVFFPYPI